MKIIANDQFYFMDMAPYYKENPMCILSLFLMNGWIKMTTCSLLSIRIMGLIIEFAAIIGSYLLLIKRNKWSYYSYALCAAIVMVGYGDSRIINPDVFTLLTVMAVIVVYIISKECAHQRFFLLLLISLFTSVSVLVRFPNIILLPIVALLLVLDNSSIWKGVVVGICYVLASILIYHVALAILTESFNPFSLLFQSVSDAATNPSGTHSISDLARGYLWGVCKIITIYFVLSIPLVFKLLMRTYNKKGVSVLWVIIIYTISFVVLFYLSAVRFGYGTYMVVPLSLCALLVTERIIQGMELKEFFSQLLLFTLFLVPALGSDTRLAKSLFVSGAMVPYLLSKVNCGFYKKDNIVLVSMVVITAIFVHTKGVDKFTMLSTLPNLEYVYETPEYIEYIYGRYDNIKDYCIKDHTIYDGEGGLSQIMYVMTESAPCFNIPFITGKNQKQRINKFIDYMEKNPSTIYIDFNNSDQEIFKNRGLDIVKSDSIATIYSFSKKYNDTANMLL